MTRTNAASPGRSGRVLAGALLLAAPAFVACGGGGGGGSSMSIQAITVQSGQTWQLNRPIDVSFSEAVDFSTVNSNTISIRQDDGTPAVGTYRLIAPNVVRFQPRCPLAPDYSDAGLEVSPAQGDPVKYTVRIPGGTDVATVRSVSGSQLAEGQPIEFFTPSVDQSLDLVFVDTVIGGPQPLVRGDNAGADATAACRIEIASDPANPIYFVSSGPNQVALEGGYELPLNLYSASSTQVTVVMEFDQALNPAASNVSSQIVRLQYEETPGAGDWQDLVSAVELIANCTTTGATVRVRPRGILPQDRNLRVLLDAGFQDIVGNTNPNATETLPMRSRIVDFSQIDPLEPNEGADELYEEFVIGAAVPGSLEDGTAAFTEARAEWGGGKLLAGFPFDGTGGPGGNFDIYLPTGQTTTFDTSSTTFAGGPDGLVTATQTAVNGRLDVRDLVVPEGATLLILGPRPARILATRNVIVNGRILAVGTNNRGVVTLNTANLPEPGAAGQAGGGRGGDGSPLSTQHSPRGQRGFGAFDTPGGGGEGGEAGYSQNNGAASRRPGGGGGGTLGLDVIDPQPNSPCTNAVPRPDNNIIGLDAEAGADGATTSIGALHPGVRAAGGLPGPRPFFDSSAENDFFGRMIKADGQVVTGELLQPWAGAGGGGGGDAIQGNVYPAPFSPALAEKGSGGGGGGGSLRILALGNVVIGPRGLINVGGGNGGGGESTSGVDRIGGGSGGGSGGHLIIETAGQIDLREVVGTLPSTGEFAPDVGLLAPGGQGGAGAANRGGAGINGVTTGACEDGIPSYSCPVPNGQAAVDSRGGDGGPGIIQLHVSSLTDILPPSNANIGTLFNRGQRLATCTGTNPNIIKNNAVIKPPAFGTPTNVKFGNTTAGWNQLIPSFGQFSRAQSVWIPLGEAGTRPGAMPAEALEFFFAGTSAVDGMVQTVSTPSGQKVAELPAVLGTALGSGSLLSLSNQSRSVTISAAGLTDDAYKRNPNLLRAFLLRVFPLGGGAQRDFEVAAASYDVDLDRFTLTVQGTGQPLAGLLNADFEVRPRFFRISTGGVLDSLPASASVRIEFQATKETLSGEPDESTGVPSDWTSDVTDLNSDPEWRFVRFRVLFDIQADGMTPLNASTPKPALEFLRVPFRF